MAPSLFQISQSLKFISITDLLLPSYADVIWTCWTSFSLPHIRWGGVHDKP